MIRHLVFLQFADGATEQTKQNLYDELASLSDCINGILDFQNRKNVSVKTRLCATSVICSGSISGIKRCVTFI